MFIVSMETSTQQLTWLQIMVNEHKDEANTTAEPVEEVDADGEVVVQPTENDRAITDDDRFERARALTAEEAASGKYSIYDIVLPTPGYDILYPSHMVKFYEETKVNDEIYPWNGESLLWHIAKFYHITDLNQQFLVVR